MEPPVKETSEVASEDEETEELLVYVEFDQVLDDEIFERSPAFKIIGLDSDETYLQIDNQIYSGRWRDTVGTALFFEEVEPPPPADPVFSNVPRKMLKYCCKTRKALELSRVFINRKKKDIEVNGESKFTCGTEYLKENEENSDSQVTSVLEDHEVAALVKGTMTTDDQDMSALVEKQLNMNITS